MPQYRPIYIKKERCRLIAVKMGIKVNHILLYILWHHKYIIYITSFKINKLRRPYHSIYGHIFFWKVVKIDSWVACLDRKESREVILNNRVTGIRQLTFNIRGRNCLQLFIDIGFRFHSRWHAINPSASIMAFFLSHPCAPPSSSKGPLNMFLHTIYCSSRL